MKRHQEIEDLGWINSYLAHDAALSYEEIESTRNFALIWNIFEGSCCTQSASISKLAEVAERVNRGGQVLENDFAQAIAYFSDRYIKNGIPNHTFDTLYFRPNDRKNFVERVLKGELTEAKDILLALLIIIFRLRNNFFHGIKSMHSIITQSDNFLHANRVLRRVIELDT
jgi:hypothetical protein